MALSMRPTVANKLANENATITRKKSAASLTGKTENMSIRADISRRPALEEIGNQVAARNKQSMQPPNEVKKKIGPAFAVPKNGIGKDVKPKTNTIVAATKVSVLTRTSSMRINGTMKTNIMRRQESTISHAARAEAALAARKEVVVKPAVKPATKATVTRSISTSALNLASHKIAPKVGPGLTKQQSLGTINGRPQPKEQPKPVKKTEVQVTVHQPCKETTAMSFELMRHVDNIDADDTNSPQMVSEYIIDIYNYLRELEKKFPIARDYLKGQEVTETMRSVLIDWLVEVAVQYNLLQETLHLTVAIIDRYLQKVKTVDRKRLQLVGITSMFLASKYEEMYMPEIEDFVYIADSAYKRKQILEMEIDIMRSLNCELGRPVPLHFLRRFSKAAGSTSHHHTMSKYFVDLALVEYDFCHYRPSEVAAAAVCLSLVLLSNVPMSPRLAWTPTLQHYSSYSIRRIEPIVHRLAALVVKTPTSKYQSVRNKYSSSKHMKISTRQELRSVNIKKYAELATPLSPVDKPAV